LHIRIYASIYDFQLYGGGVDVEYRPHIFPLFSIGFAVKLQHSRQNYSCGHAFQKVYMRRFHFAVCVEMIEEDSSALTIYSTPSFAGGVATWALLN
jgi:hypothetical protein